MQRFTGGSSKLPIRPSRLHHAAPHGAAGAVREAGFFSALDWSTDCTTEAFRMSIFVLPGASCRGERIGRKGIPRPPDA